MSAVADPLPALAEAAAPPEVDGLSRDSVRLLAVLMPDGEMRDLRFTELADLLEAGDLIVINTSGTRASALDARRENGSRVTVNLSSPAPEPDHGRWLVELRDGDRPLPAPVAGERLDLPDRGVLRLIAPYLGRRLWLASLALPTGLSEYLDQHARPIRYGHTSGERRISEYQNVYATESGSAEMPSAGRPFTAGVITHLIARGVDVAPLVLHTGVSSLERGEHPYAERFRVPVSTTARVELTRRLGGRVIAVGTTVVRALESCVAEDGHLHPTGGWTDLVLDRDTPVRAVDGILTGFHDPDASHLDLLEAVAPGEVVAAAYRTAAKAGYRRHEFGDLLLIAPRRDRVRVTGA
jgi:S-adenosylmethionine:tRNA ribosyltransferase-isomerase